MFNSNKNKIRFIIYKKNRQVIQKKVEPKSNSFTYNGNSYIIDKENFYIWKNIATYSYREEVPIPLALKELQVIKGKEYIDFENVLRHIWVNYYLYCHYRIRWGLLFIKSRNSINYSRTSKNN